MPRERLKLTRQSHALLSRISSTYTEISEQSLYSSKGKQEASEVDPSRRLVSYEPVSGKVRRKRFQHRPIVHYQVVYAEHCIEEQPYDDHGGKRA